jgi:thiamine pyrophosphate-dependent acetolactate synthase large subunit-like protein
MADALADGIPLVVFSGQVPTTAIGTDAFQEGVFHFLNILKSIF